MPDKPLSPPPAATPLPRAREQQLAPGVYFTPALRPSARPSAGARPVEELSLEELRCERDALRKSVAMLRASNAEIRAFDPAQADPDLVAAVSENLAIIIKRQARATALDDRIRVLSPGEPCDAPPDEPPAGAAAVPDPPSAEVARASVDNGADAGMFL